MKKFIFFIACTFLVFSLFGEKWISINSDEPASAEINLISSNLETSIVHINLDGYFMNEVTTPRGSAYVINVGNGTSMLEEGYPDLAKLTASLIIPDRAEMAVEVISSEYLEYTDIEVAPSKGNLTRDIDPSKVSYKYGEIYNNDMFYPGELAGLRDPYILRDHRGQTLIIYPFQYNPVTKTLRVYTDLTVRIFATGNEGKNPLHRTVTPETVSQDFNILYDRHFMNATQTRYTPVEEEGNMLIICYADFFEAMLPFVEWKTLSGRPVEMVDVAEIGNSNAIKTYVADYYNTFGLTYLLLVGDAAQVPSSYASGDSDNDYGYIVGSDHYPDIFVGRFSAETVDHVETQVNRTLEYEQTPYSSEWFTRSVGIASSQGPGDDNEYDYVHIRNMQNDLLGFTYTYNGELFDGSQGGNDASGNPNPAMVTDEVETGTGIMLYTGHGSTSAWSTSGFSSSDVNQLENSGMYPFIWSVACVNGNFVNATCFAEAWLRATDNATGEPTGAIATLMSTINQSWDPPMEGQDEMVDILVESYAGNIKRTFGGISMNGCMQMNDSYGGAGDQMTDTWNCFGDPSVMVRTSIPLSITAEYLNPLPLFTTELEVSTNCPNGLVCLTFNGDIISTAYVQGGVANLTFEPITELDPLDIVITSFNRLPYIGTIEVVGEPAAPIYPFPANGLSRVHPFTGLHWQDGQGGIPDTYTLYLGTDNPPTNFINGLTLTEKMFDLPEDLEYETEYFWRVDSHNEFGNATGDVWNFTTNRAPDESFETSDFLSYFWNFTGNTGWIIDDTFSFYGDKSSKSGVIGDNESSSMIITLEVTTMFYSSISFWKKVSSEFNDHLQFLIDGEIIAEWSGTFADWSEESFPVQDGVHTFEWRYIKDGSGSEGDDCAWIDYIYFPSLTTPWISAGDDDQICEDLDFATTGLGYNFCYLEWTTTGTGTFDDSSILDAQYFPSADDWASGDVMLTVTAHTNEGDISDDMLLTFDQIPIKPDMPVGPEYVDLFYTTSSEYECPHAANATSLIWDIEPDYAGTLDGDGTSIIVTWDPTYLGMATISVMGVNDCGESEFSELLEITLDNTVGIDNKLSSSSIHVLPNPNNGEFKLEISTGNEEKVRIRIIDVVGNTIYEESEAILNTGFSQKFDLKNYRQGLYFILIEGGDTNTVKKFVIQ